MLSRGVYMHDNAPYTSQGYVPPSEERGIYAGTPLAMLRLHDLPEIARALSRLLIVFFLFMAVSMIAIPWRQTSQGSGRVIAYLPQERVQNVHATVAGRIKHLFVREGSTVKKDDPILEVVDIDPQFLRRVKLERDALKRQYEAAQHIVKTAAYDMNRQTDLYHKGIAARKDMEQAIIAYKNAQSGEAQALANLTQADSRLARQESQVLKAPMDGTIVRLMVGSSNVVVDQGQVVAVFVPMSNQLAAELFISGNDLPLVYEGRDVRLQFEGWPAVQFSGWPSVSIGTFPGKVAVVDQTATPDGLFRVIVVPEEGKHWPESRFIRQGTRVNGWVQLNEVRLWYEAWRQFNGFPPSLEDAPKGLGSPDLSILQGQE